MIGNHLGQWQIGLVANLDSQMGKIALKSVVQLDLGLIWTFAEMCWIGQQYPRQIAALHPLPHRHPVDRC